MSFNKNRPVKDKLCTVVEGVHEPSFAD